MNGFCLNDLENYFTLVVGFVFVFNSIPFFRNPIIQALTKGFTDKAEASAAKIESMQSKITLISKEEFKKSADETINLATNKLSKLSKMNDTLVLVHSGDIFKVYFYITGAIYLTFILLVNFHKVLDLNFRTPYEFSGIITLGTYTYFVLTSVLFWVKCNYGKGDKPNYFSSRKALKVYFISSVILFSVLLVFNHFVPCGSFIRDTASPIVFDLIDTPYRATNKFILMFMVVGLPVLPLTILYLRYALFGNGLSDRINDAYINIDILFKSLENDLRDIDNEPIEVANIPVVGEIEQEKARI